MESISTLNLNKICRVCLLESDQMSSIYSELYENQSQIKMDNVHVPCIYEILISVSSIKMQPDDGLPSMICSKCIDMVHIIFKFQKQCNRSQVFLDAYLKQCPQMVDSLMEVKLNSLEQNHQNELVQQNNHSDPNGFLEDQGEMLAVKEEETTINCVSPQTIEEISDEDEPEFVDPLDVEKALGKKIKIENGEKICDPEILTDFSSDEENLITSKVEISGMNKPARGCVVIPEKSEIVYKKTYCDYYKWCTKMKVEKCYTEKSLLAYFDHLSKIRKPSSLWSYYSMLKATLKVYHNVDVTDYSELFGFLKRKSDGYKPQKAHVLFTKENVETFLYEAPDEIYLMIKVALIFGLAGACRREELVNLKKDDIQELQRSLLITCRDRKTKTNRKFFVADDCKTPSVLSFYKKYADLRPPHTESDRFFLAYKNGECNRQVVGKYAFGQIPKKIATYLKLPSPELYAGYSIIRSTAKSFKKFK